MGKKKAESFESLLAEAEEIARRLEGGELTLDESLREYEKGVANLRRCAQLVAAAEERVKILIEKEGEGPVLEDFEPADASEEE